MLLNLHVKNMALIEEVDVDFENGLIVFTGETGAGKSLILGSVNIALGQKASKDLIRPGADYSLVELTFRVDENVAECIRQMDIEMEDDTVTITRKISETRSVSKINGETVNLTTLKEAMSMLLDIYGQHEHQSLLYPKKQMEILDTFASEEEGDLPAQLKSVHNIFLKLNKQLAELDIDEEKRIRELEFAQYEINEIRSANLKADDEEELEAQFKMLSNRKNIAAALSNIYNDIGYDNGNGAGEAINHAIREIIPVSDFDDEIKEMQTMLYDIDSLCRELSGNIYEYNRRIEYDESYIDELTRRLDLVNHLKLKYGKTIEDILHYAEEKEKYVERLKNLQFEVENVKKQIDAAQNQMVKLSENLSEIRKHAAKNFERLVADALKDLNFLTVDFQINFSKKDIISENGYDNIEFMISTNPGQPVKPLAKVASGGELSRIMLAVKSILATEDDVDTLIFDEIDVGISGRTASKVSEKLAKISRKHQVICISHLSQIAAMADDHYLIDKKIENDNTYTNIRKLNRDESIREIVRINGGSDVTDAAVTQATELKDMAERVKSNLSE